MIPTLAHNDDFLLAKLHSEFEEIIHDMDANKPFRKRISTNLGNVTSIMERLNAKAFSSLSIKTYLLESMRSILFILEVFISITFFLSAAYHCKIDIDSHNFIVSKKYFTKVSTTDTSGDPYIANYRKPRYIIQTLSHESINSTVSAIHSMLHGIYIFVEGLTSYNETFCNLQKYPKLLTRSNIDTAPDGYLSMIILSVNTFLWMTYMILTRARMSLENLVSKTHSTYIQMTCLAKITKGLSTCFTKMGNRDVEAISRMLIQNDISQLITSDYTLKKILPEDIYIEISNLIRSNELNTSSQRSVKLTFLVIFLINILGIYNSKNTNIELDNVCICLWDATKIAIMVVLQLI